MPFEPHLSPLAPGDASPAPDATLGLISTSPLLMGALGDIIDALGTPRLWTWPSLSGFSESPTTTAVTLIERSLLGFDPLLSLELLAHRTNAIVINVDPPGSEHALVLLAAGARGVLLPHATTDEIGAAVRQTSAGRRHLPWSLNDELTEALTNGYRPAFLSLSRREREIVCRAVMTNSANELADALCLSPTTVRTHLKRVYRKLGVNSQGGAVRELLRVGALVGAHTT